jgi:hypothetical protein
LSALLFGNTMARPDPTTVWVGACEIVTKGKRVESVQIISHNLEHTYVPGCTAKATERIMAAQRPAKGAADRDRMLK